MGIYTRTGDRGTTARLNGERVSKTSPLIEANGALDELNAALGVCRQCCGGLSLPGGPWQDAGDLLFDVQRDVFTMGAALSMGSYQDHPLPDSRVPDFEAVLDAVQESCGELSDFLVPGEDPADASLHVCRAVCRRAERRVLALGDRAPQPILVYLNRLADLLFVLSVAHRHLESLPPFHPGAAR